MESNEKKLSFKKVRMSNDKPAESSTANPDHQDPPASNAVSDKLDDFLKRNSSTHSSFSSIHSARRNSRIPSILLNTLNDKRLMIQHVM